MVRPLDVIRWIGRNSKAIAVTIVGGVLVMAGLAMLLLPGPGLLVVIAGLAVLASQYAWAQRALDKTKEKAKQAGGVAKRTLFGRKRKT